MIQALTLLLLMLIKYLFIYEPFFKIFVIYLIDLSLVTATARGKRFIYVGFSFSSKHYYLSTILIFKDISDDNS